MNIINNRANRGVRDCGEIISKQLLNHRRRCCVCIRQTKRWHDIEKQIRRQTHKALMKCERNKKLNVPNNEEERRERKEEEKYLII